MLIIKYHIFFNLFVISLTEKADKATNKVFLYIMKTRGAS